MYRLIAIIRCCGMQYCYRQQRRVVNDTESLRLQIIAVCVLLCLHLAIVFASYTMCAAIAFCGIVCQKCALSPPLDNIRVMVIAWRLRGNIRTALCWIV